MPASKRPGDDDLDPEASNKVARIDAALVNGNSDHGDILGSVRKKTAGSTRTGQACDRCKVRKIRCDARPGGCSPCLQNNTECKTTDRITGRATSRGHTEQIETENTTLKVYMAELQQQLRDLGVEPKLPPNAPHGYIPASTAGASSVQLWGRIVNGNDVGSGGGDSWGTEQSQEPQAQPDNNSLLPPARPQTERQSSQTASPLPEFRAGCIGDNYLGVSSENNWLSPIEGTSLALFGTKIDLSEFMPSETDPASTALSYQTFLNHAFGRIKPFAPTLPDYQECTMYAGWYFRSIQQFLPLIHKPHFMTLLDRMYHEGYSATSAETVMVHMVLAIIKFQFSARNGHEQSRQASMAHYHYALSFIPDLITSHKLEDIQALAVICSQLRSQPRPGAAWMFINMVMGLAIESGLHRSAKAWAGSLGEQDPHQLEMRKRIFWSLLCYHVHISGKLGRPMPFRTEDFDIEMPDAVFDNLPSESNLSDWRKCSWRAGIEGFKLGKIQLQIYSSIYSIKSTGQYETNLRQLEKDLEAFAAQIPVEFRGGKQTQDEDRVSALYLDVTMAGCQLLLHHPSLCRSESQQLLSHNLDVCLHWSSKLLAAAVQLKTLKSLDTTWYYSTDFLAAIFTTLFAHSQRIDQMTSSDLQRLRQDMASWLDVMGEIGDLLGTGPKLQNAIRTIVDFAVNRLNRHIVAKTASAAVAKTESTQDQGSVQQQQQQDQQHHLYESANGYHGSYTNGSGNGAMNGGQAQGYLDHQQNHNGRTQNGYQSNAQFGYSNAHTNGMTYSTANMSGFDANNVYSQDAKPNLEAQLVAHNASLSQPPHSAGPNNGNAGSNNSSNNNNNNFMTATAAYGPNHNPIFGPNPSAPSSVPAVYTQAGPAAWRSFADTVMTNLMVGGGHDYMNSAGALMALSEGNKPADASSGMDPRHHQQQQHNQQQQQQQQQQQHHLTPANVGGLSLAHHGGGDVNGAAAAAAAAAGQWPLIHYHHAGNE